MFTIAVRQGEAFAAEQKIRELKTRISEINNQKLKISPAEIIETSTLNMNLIKSKKYDLSPEEIERRALSGELFKTIFSMQRLKKTQRLHRRLEDYDAKKYSAKRKKLRDEPFIGEKIFVLAERKE